MRRYQQTSPESHFTQKRICTLATSAGRITLSDQHLTLTKNGEREKHLLNEQEYRTVLAEQFGIVLPSKA